MTPAEAIKMLDLLPHATREQIEERFVEQRALLEDKAAKALTPKLQAQYREALARITEAYETLVLAEEAATLPSLQPEPTVLAQPVASARGSYPEKGAAAQAAVDSFGPWIMRLIGGFFRCVLAVIAGSMVVAAIAVAIEERHLVLPPQVDDMVFLGGCWVLLAGLPGLAWWVYAVRRARHKALAKFEPDSAPPTYSFLPSCLVVITLAAVVLAQYYVRLDSKESALADELSRSAGVHANRGEWMQAVAVYGQARALRPHHQGYAREHDLAQQTWIDALAAKVGALPPEQAYAQLTRESGRSLLWLTSPTRERYAKLFAATVTRMEKQLQATGGEVGSLLAEGKVKEASAVVERLRPLAQRVPGFQAMADRVEVAEFEYLLDPVREATGKGDYPSAYTLLAKMTPAKETHRRLLREAVIDTHLSEWFAAVERTGSLILKGEFIAAEDTFLDLEVLIDEMSKLDGYAEAMKAKEIAPAEMLTGLRQGWRGELMRRTVLELAPALAANDAALAQDILKAYANLNGYEPTITGEQLVKEKSLQQFLGYLGLLDLRTVEPSEPASLSALALVRAALPHFDRQEPARQFLAEGYHAAAEALLKNGKPGLALHVQREAMKWGAAADASLEQNALKLFAENNPVRLGLPPITAEGADSTLLADALRQTLKTTLETATHGLLVLEDMDGGEGEQSRRLVLQPEFSGISSGMGRDAMDKKLRRQTGEERVVNPSYSALTQRIEVRTKGLLGMGSIISRMETGLQKARETGNQAAIVEAQKRVDDWLARREQLKKSLKEDQEQIGKLPQYITQATYVETPYQQVSHHRNHEAGLRLTLVNGALPDGRRALAAWQTSLRYATLDIKGDAQRGVPVQTAAFLKDSEVAEWLRLDLTAKIKAQAPALLKELAQTVHEAKTVQLSRDSSRTELPTEFECGWVAFWQNCGVQLPGARAEAAVRQLLWLPDSPVASEPPVNPPAGWLAENSLGMRFTPVPSTQVMFSVWEARVQDFAAFVSETHYDATAAMNSLTSEGWQVKGANWRDPGFKQDAMHPVCGVSWDDAKAFCAWLTKKEQAAGTLARNLEYRLPTMTEWLQAATAGRDDRAKISLRPGIGNLAGGECNDVGWPADRKAIAGYADGFVYTAPVGWFSSNALGIYDLEGNLSEWCLPDDRSAAGMPVPVMGSNYATGETEVKEREPRRALTLSETRNSSHGFRVVIAPVGN